MIRGRQVKQFRTKELLPDQRDFYDGKRYLGTVCLGVESSTIFLEGRTESIKINTLLHKPAKDYHPQYLSRLMRRLFLAAYTKHQATTQTNRITKITQEMATIYPPKGVVETVEEIRTRANALLLLSAPLGGYRWEACLAKPNNEELEI